MDIITHKEICEYLEIPKKQTTKYPWIVKATVINIYVEGHNRFNFGGEISCAKCGYGVTMLRDKSKCPKCGHN